MIIETATSSNLVPTSSNLVPDEVREDSSNLVPYVPRRGREDEVRGGIGGALKSTREDIESGTRFDCVKCSVEVGPDLVLCPTCYAKKRPPVCPTCGGRLAGGKCGWC